VNKSAFFFIMAILPFFTSGCASVIGNTDAFEEKNHLDDGASGADIRKALGSPGDVEKRQSKEAWKYCKNDLMASHQEYLIIWLHDDRFVGHTTFTQKRGLVCGGEYPRVSWDGFPETTASR